MTPGATITLSVLWLSLPLVPQFEVKVPREPLLPLALAPFAPTPSCALAWTFVMSTKSAATGPLPPWPFCA